MTSTTKKQSGFASMSLAQKISATTLGILAVQFLIGMFINLYANLPLNPDYEEFTSVMMRAMGKYNSFMLIHVVLGISLVFSSSAIYFLAMLSRCKTDIILASMGLVGILLSAYSGLDFFMAGQQNHYSLIMSFGFIISFISYFLELMFGKTQ